MNPEKDVSLPQKSVYQNNSNNESFDEMKNKVLISEIALLIALIVGLVLLMEGYNILFGVSMILFLLIFAYLLISVRHKDVDWKPNPVSENIQTITDTYGTPDDIIVVNPTRGSELDGVILVYDKKGFLYINGIILNKDEITDISFFNSAIPYMANDYQIVIKTSSERYPSVYLSVGNDLGWAKDLYVQIKTHFRF